MIYRINITILDIIHRPVFGARILSPSSSGTYSDGSNSKKNNFNFILFHLFYFIYLIEINFSFFNFYFILFLAFYIDYGNLPIILQFDSTDPL
jgi:hypothetical protein